MNFTEIVIEIGAGDVETAAAIANMAVSHGIYIEDYSDLEAEAQRIAHINLIDEELLAKDRDVAWVHVYILPENNPVEAIEFLRRRLGSAGVKNKISTKACRVEDYINNWKQYFRPVAVSERLLICPSWRRDEVKPNGRAVLQIDPGLAFGTGAHETTSLCLSLLEKYMKPGAMVLDIGCGSGILSVASILLGAKAATGVDIDELAVKTAAENAKVNGVSDKFTAVCGNLVDKIRGQFDVIVANIVADVIIELNKSVKNYMHKRSMYLMSGIIEQNEIAVCMSLEPDFNVIDVRRKNGWVAIVAMLKR